MHLTNQLKDVLFHLKQRKYKYVGDCTQAIQTSDQTSSNEESVADGIRPFMISPHASTQSHQLMTWPDNGDYIL